MIIEDADSAPFWAACREHRLICRRDTVTGTLHHYPREHAPGTLNPTEWVELSGRGTVYSFTVVHRGERPYTLALIDLEEGVRMLSNVEGEVAIGAPVTVAWRERDDVTLPIFVPR